MSQVVGEDMITGMGYIGLDLGRLYRMRRVPKLIDAVASGTTIIIRDATEERPFQGLRVFGKSTQDGTPTPEAPVPIVSAGEGGSIEVKVMGKNLINIHEIKTGINVNQVECNIFGNLVFSSVAEGLNLEKDIWRVRFVTKSGVSIYVADSKMLKNVITVAEDDPIVFYEYRNQYINSGRYTNIQLEHGDTPTEYEPYRDPQLLTLQTPNGLPGVPVAKDGNYTDANGQQWVCDEIDLKRGKYIERIWKKTLDGSEPFWGIYLTTGYEGFSTNILPFNSYRRNGFCDLFNVKEVSDFEESVWLGVNNSNIYVVKSRFFDSTLEDKGLANWKAFLAGNPMTVMTYMDTPLERDITPEENAAYKALRTYGPTTVITNDTGAHMEVIYNKSNRNME